LSYDELWSLTELKNFVTEVLRRYPIAPYLLLQNNQPVVMEGKTIPSNTVFGIPLGHLQMKLFPNGEKFDPERWKSTGESDQEAMYQNLPFGGGKRICVGMNLALTEIMCTVALILSNFQIIIPKESENIDLDDSISAFSSEPRSRISLDLVTL